jgi:lipopolysaccharide biosynthesis regulator YciM
MKKTINQIIEEALDLESQAEGYLDRAEEVLIQLTDKRLTKQQKEMLEGMYSTTAYLLIHD